MSQVHTYPKKLFYKINEVSEIVGVEAYVLRYWETKFTILKPERLGNDERRYRAKDIDLLLRIRSLLYDEKFTIAGAVDRIRKDPHGQLDIAEIKNVIDISEGGVPAPEVEQGGAAQLEFLSDEPGVAAAVVKARLADIRRELVALRDEMGNG